MQQYRKMGAREHVLERPGTYIGATEKCEGSHWVVEEGRMRWVTALTTPCLVKFLDECLINARDQAVRCAPTPTPVTYIEVVLGDDGSVSVSNDGAGIIVDKHPEYGVMVPELIFGHLRTSSNYTGSEDKKIVGGQNGLGVKLVNIWSTWTEIDLAGPGPEGEGLLRYTQRFRDNMSIIDPPKVVKYKNKTCYTTLKYLPDYKRLKLEAGLDPETKALLVRRVYDIAAVTDKKVKVYLNGELVPVKSFLQYTSLFFPPEQDDRLFEASDRWEVAVANSDEFRQVSFVNGIATPKGGKHVDDVVNQLVRKVTAVIQQKKKVEVRPAIIKDLLFVFINCCVENPSFDSQSKEYLTTPAATFGSRCELSEKFVDKVARMVMSAAIEMTERKDAAAAKKTDGAKKRHVKGVAKLSDAANAGTAKSSKCVLFLCEGDSAMAGIKSGLTEEMRKWYGVYPLKGKPLNPRRSTQKVSDNAEMIQLKQILGLESGRQYTLEEAQARLRYGEVRLMTDQDLDGAHIKGLCINIFDALWPSLIRDPTYRFLSFMNTPIIKARKGTEEICFYNDGQFRAWQEAQTKGLHLWSIKYYKGLGTSTGKEFTQYLKPPKAGGTGNVVYFTWSEQSADALSVAFDESRADGRKRWLDTYDRGLYVDTALGELSYEWFVNRELIHFSQYDNERSIPNVVDGFKPSQRKILFAAFKKGLTKEIKVAQFSGYVSEHASYHHGEASLNGAIVNMAQNFVGSNNVNLLMPNGQFGTRLQGGKDSASERYIYTELNPLTRRLFPAEDDAILTYLQDDGTAIEPDFYAPCLPMILINGGKGIGTGYSTDVPCFNPKQVLECVVARLRGTPYSEPFVPFYRGFKGTITSLGDGKFATTGLYKVDGLTVTIQELPVGTWTDDYKMFLDGLTGSVVKEFSDHSTDLNVHFVVKLNEPVELLEKVLKLVTVKHTNNMFLFTPEAKLKKYASAADIIDDYMPVRMAAYVRRKAHLLQALRQKLLKADNKVRYIKAVLAGTIELRGVKKHLIDALLQENGLDQLDGSYNYLIKMPMDTVAEENVEALTADMISLEEEVQELSATSERDLWLRDLAKCAF